MTVDKEIEMSVKLNTVSQCESLSLSLKLSVGIKRH